MHPFVIVLGPDPRLDGSGQVHPTDEDPYRTVAIPQHPERSRLVRDMIEGIVADSTTPECPAVGAKRQRERAPPLAVEIDREFTVTATSTHLGSFHDASFVRTVQFCVPTPPTGLQPLSSLVAPIPIEECLRRPPGYDKYSYDDLVDAGLADEIQDRSDDHDDEVNASLSLVPRKDNVGVVVNEVASCSPFACMWHASVNVVSGALSAVNRLFSSRDVKAAAYPFGGRHHARSDRASGFCVFNDVVIAVLEVKRVLSARQIVPKVLVIDVDAHHGDGTEAAFALDPHVTTLSSHGYGPGFFPGTGGSSFEGAVNIPLPLGSSDAIAVPAVTEKIREQFFEVGGWHCCVLVVGTDAVRGDPFGGLNMTIPGLRSLVLYTMRCCVSVGAKLLVLGSGGYVDVTAARCWGAIVRDGAREFGAASPPNSQPPSGDMPPLPTEVPTSLEFFGRYGPTFHMEISPPPRP